MKTYRSFSEAWFEELHNTRLSITESSPRGMRTLEQLWRQFAVEDSLSFPVGAYGRTFRNVIGILEGLSLVGQFNIPELFTQRVGKFTDFLDDGLFHGAYAIRAHGALGEVVSLLERDPDSRQAVISVFDSARDLNRKKKDIPCTIALHFMQRGEDLELRVTMRSNDIWLGTPYDFMQFGILQASVAQALRLRPGRYVHSVGSLHLYETNFNPAALVTSPAYNGSMGFPLWGAYDIGEISKRARDLALGVEGFLPVTEFEAWAWTELHG